MNLYTERGRKELHHLKRQGISLLRRMGRRPPRGRILRGAGAKVIPPLGREAQKGFSVELLGLSRKTRFGWNVYS